MTPTTRRAPGRFLRVAWSALAMAVIASIALLSFGDAGAQDEQADATRTISVGRVDATGDSVVVDGWLTGAQPDQIEVEIGGETVAPSSARLASADGRTTDVVVVLDNAVALGNAAVQLSKQGLEPLMPGAGAVDSLGIVSTGDVARIEVGQTTSATQVRAALDGIRPEGVAAVWDGLAKAAELLEDRGPTSNGTVVLFTASASSFVGGGPSAAESALRRAGVDLQVVALPLGADLAAVQGIVSDVSGSLEVVNTDEELAPGYQRVADRFAGRFLLELPPVEGGAEVESLTLTADDVSTSVAFVPGAMRVGAAALAPVADTGGGLAGILANPAMKWIIVLLGVAAAVMLVWAVMSIVMPEDNDLVQRLEVYEDPYGERVEDDFTAAEESHATVPIIKRAVDLTGDIADRRGVTDKLEARLERANLPLRAAEAIFFMFVVGCILTLLAFVLTRNVFVALGAAVLTFALPQALLNMRIRRRQKAFVAQLPDMLTLLAGTLRAGYSISQGFESVSTEISEPMGRELRRVVTESRLGRSLEEALDAVAERMDSDDFSWAVMAIKIQREVGGNLAELLLTVANTMTERERLRRDVSTLTAEGRMSAIIIGLLPPGLAVVMWIMNPSYISELFQPGLGYVLLGVAVVMMGIGFAWMKKTITIEV
ncbi:MAG: type II secretion system F family protein [Microthrixaceae bacterium]